ncbi:MAG: sulfite exporter TauE/SafE family protein, partial [Armatimonadota bacterium]
MSVVRQQAGLGHPSTHHEIDSGGALLLWDPLILNLGAFIIGLSKAGFGGFAGVVVGPMLALWRPPREAIGLMLPLLIAGDLFSVPYYWRKWDQRNLLLLAIPAVIGILLGTQILAGIADAMLKRTIGAIALLFSIGQIVRERWTENAPAWKVKPAHAVAAGLTAGAFSTIAHLGGLPVVFYLLPQRLPAVRFVATSVWLFFLINLLKLPPYVQQGLITAHEIRTVVWLLPATGLGALVGV